MADWSDRLDSGELLIRLDVALVENAELREELARLRADNVRMRGLLGQHAGTGPTGMPPVSEPVVVPSPTWAGGLPHADASSSAEAKIALFRALFAGRDDVYAKRWVSAKSGRTGWSPAEDNPFDKTKSEADRVFWPLTDETVYCQPRSVPAGARRGAHRPVPAAGRRHLPPARLRLRRQGRQ